MRHEERLPAENGELFFPLLKAITPIPTRILLRFFLIKNMLEKKLGSI